MEITESISKIPDNGDVTQTDLSFGTLYDKETTRVPKVGPDSGKSAKKWTRAEDELLIRLASASNGKRWKWIADQIPTKRDSQCRSRWERIKPGMKQGRWTHEEDELLKSLSGEYGNKWSEMAKHLNCRTGKQVRDRLRNVLDPNLNKSEFRLEDDQKVYHIYKEQGPKWKKIRDEYFPERTADFIKNRFYSYFRKNRHKLFGETETTSKTDKSPNTFAKENNEPAKNKLNKGENKIRLRKCKLTGNLSLVASQSDQQNVITKNLSPKENKFNNSYVNQTQNLYENILNNQMQNKNYPSNNFPLQNLPVDSTTNGSLLQNSNLASPIFNYGIIF